MYINQWKSHMVGNNNNQTTQFGELEHQSFEPVDISVWNNEFPTTTTTESPFLFCQASDDNYSTNDQFTASLQVVEESLMSSSEDSVSSSQKYAQFPSCSGKHGDFISGKTPFWENFPQGHIKVQEGDAAPDLEISFQRSQWNSCTKQEKPSSDCGVTFATSSNSDSKRTGKRRIRWTNDMHEPFILTVNSLGGPEKAKPKAILEMMGSDVLTISHVKSHLQKYRSTSHMDAALKGRSDNKGHRTDSINELQVKIQMQIEETRQLHFEVQKSNQRQLEMHQHFQLLIEQQRKQLKLLLHQQRQRTKLEKNHPHSERTEGVNLASRIINYSEQPKTLK